MLLPYVSRGAEEFAARVGNTAADKAGELLAALRGRFRGDPEASENLARFQDKPDRYTPVLEDILVEKLHDDPALADELRQLLEAMGPSLDVVLTMEEGEDVTGLDVDEMASGKAKVDVSVRRGKRVTGARMKRLG